MKRLVALLALACALLPLCARAQDRQQLVFAVVVSRHGVRSISKPPSQYSWADWQPVAPSFLTARGYQLMTYEGQFYRLYFGAHGIPISCDRPNVMLYADKDQRTLATGQALIEGMCGKNSALRMLHDADLARSSDDPLFDATQWALAQHRIDTGASRRAVLAALPLPPSAVVSAHRSDFDALERLMQTRCAGSCAPVTSGETSLTDKEGLTEVSGPVKTASTYAEDLFLESAQCRPQADLDLAGAMRLHVLAYEINARNRYNPLVRGGTLFAHIVAMLEAKAGKPTGDVGIPDISHDNVAFFSGHDTELGALGGILDAHWKLGNGLVPDDMPPGGALMFELYRTTRGDYRVRMRFVYETMEQFHHYRLLERGIAVTPVTTAGCASGDCSLSLDALSAISRRISTQGLVRNEWTNDSSDPVSLDPLVNPKWTQCKP